MEKNSINKRADVTFIASVVLNVVLIFLSFQNKDSNQQISTKYEQQFAQEKEQSFGKRLNQYEYTGKVLNNDLLLITGSDSSSLKKLMEGKREHIFMISGFKNCATCLYQELDRLKQNLPEKLIVIAMRGLEDEFYYFWTQNKLKIPLYFANLQLLGINPNNHSKPFYFVTDSTLKVSDLLLTESSDKSDFIERYWKIVSQK